MKTKISGLLLIFASAVLTGCGSLAAKNYSSLAGYHFGKSEFERAEKYLTKALEKDPDNEGALTLAGWTYFKMDQYDRSLATFQTLAAEHPKAVEAYTGQGWNYFKKLDYDQAISYFEQALKVDKHSADAYAGLGWASLRKGDVANAEIYFQNSLRKGMRYKSWDKVVKTEPEAHRGLGYLNFGREDYKKAAHHFKIATQFRPDWNDARIKCADCLFSLKKHDESIHLYKQSLRYAKTAEIYDKIGWSYYYLGSESGKDSAKNKNFKQARKWFDKALALDPSYSSSLAGLAKLDAA